MNINKEQGLSIKTLLSDAAFKSVVKILQQVLIRPQVKMAIKFLLLFSLFFLISWHRLDPDFGWHLQAGNYILHHWIPSHDVFTYTAQSFPWIDHEWGNDVITSWFYSLGGYAALSILFAAIWSVALFINGAKTRLLILLLAVTALLPFAGIRPTAWTVAFFALLLRLLETKSKRAKYFIPLLFIFWANLHGGFILGLATIFYFGLRQRKKEFGYLFIASILATFINPYGPRLYVEVARTLFDRSLHAQITEWHIFAITLVSLVFMSLWWAGFWLFERQKLSSWLGLKPILFVASLSAVRNVPLFVVATFKDLDIYYQDFISVLPTTFKKTRRAVIDLAITATLSWTGYNFYTNLWIWYPRESGYPSQAVVYLQSHKCSGNLFNNYNSGGYLIWKLPSQPVYIDGRMPSWRDEAGHKYLDKYFEILDNTTAHQAEFQRYNVRCVLVKSGYANMISDLKKSGWQETVKADGYVLLLAP